MHRSGLQTLVATVSRGVAGAGAARQGVRPEIDFLARAVQAFF